MRVLRRMGSVFVAPPEPVAVQWSPPRAGGWAPGDPATDERRSASAMGARCVAVVGRPADALPAGASAALALAARRSCSHALLCVWIGGAAPPAGIAAPPHRGAARLARSLAAGDLPVRATGRLVVARLPAGDGPADEAARALRAAAGDVPVVLALGAARGPRLDDLLGELDAVLVAVRAGADDAVGRLATAGIAGAATCPVPSGAGRTLAAAGIALPSALRRHGSEVVP